jgi:phosphotriesterase-related protein
MVCCVEYYTLWVEGIYKLYFTLPQNTPIDKQRIQDITELIDEGYIERITIATDRCTKHFPSTYRGGGYERPLRNDVPLMKNLGMNDEQIDKLLIENPKRLLTVI